MLAKGCGDEKIAVFVILAVVFPLAVFQDRNAASKSLHVQSIDRVVSAQLTPAHAWLQGSTVVGDAKGQFASLGGSRTVLTLMLKTGESLSIGSISRKVDNGVEVRSQSIEGQVTIHDKDKAMRIIAPDVEMWINFANFITFLLTSV